MHTTVVQPHKSSLGLDANLMVLIVYVATAVVSWIPYIGWVAWVVPLVFFFLEKSSGFVKFHAVQALGIGVLRAVLTIIFNIVIWSLVPRTLGGLYVGWGALGAVSLIATILYLAITALTIYVVVMAWMWKSVSLPIIGPMAAKSEAKLDEFAQQQASAFQQQTPQYPPQQAQPYPPQQAAPYPPQQVPPTGAGDAPASPGV